MRIDVVNVPGELASRDLSGATVVVFDVLRATTTMTTGLAAGANGIWVFPSHELALKSAATRGEFVVCAGETRCVMPAGFDIGNSPRQWTRQIVGGREVCLSTTNGTKAIYAARSAKRLFIGAVVNAAAVARALREIDGEVVLVGAGQEGGLSEEDQCGCGAVVDAICEMRSDVEVSKEARLARATYRFHRDDLTAFFRTTEGGRNLIAAGLEADIDACAARSVLDVVGRCEVVGESIVVRSL
jgi:2-phosphosulfolactate phosphatase